MPAPAGQHSLQQYFSRDRTIAGVRPCANNAQALLHGPSSPHPQYHRHPRRHPGAVLGHPVLRLRHRGARYRARAGLAGGHRVRGVFVVPAGIRPGRHARRPADRPPWRTPGDGRRLAVVRTRLHPAEPGPGRARLLPGLERTGRVDVGRAVRSRVRHPQPPVRPRRAPGHLDRDPVRRACQHGVLAADGATEQPGRLAPHLPRLRPRPIAAVPAAAPVAGQAGAHRADAAASARRDRFQPRAGAAPSRVLETRLRVFGQQFHFLGAVGASDSHPAIVRPCPLKRGVDGRADRPDAGDRASRRNALCPQRQRAGGRHGLLRGLARGLAGRAVLGPAPGGGGAVLHAVRALERHPDHRARHGAAAAVRRAQLRRHCRGPGRPGAGLARGRPDRDRRPAPVRCVAGAAVLLAAGLFAGVADFVSAGGAHPPRPPIPAR